MSQTQTELSNLSNSIHNFSLCQKIMFLIWFVCRSRTPAFWMLNNGMINHPIFSPVVNVVGRLRERESERVMRGVINRNLHNIFVTTHWLTFTQFFWNIGQSFSLSRFYDSFMNLWYISFVRVHNCGCTSLCSRFGSIKRKGKMKWKDRLIWIPSNSTVSLKWRTNRNIRSLSFLNWYNSFLLAKRMRARSSFLTSFRPFGLSLPVSSVFLPLLSGITNHGTSSPYVLGQGRDSEVLGEREKVELGRVERRVMGEYQERRSNRGRNRSDG